jgi:LytS/YehU family sensor histidine kinase
VAAHLAAACLFSAANVLLNAWLIAGEKSVMHPGKILTFSYLLRMTGVHYFVTNVILYWFVVSAHQGWHYYRRYREHEVQTAELRRELVEAKLAALRMQLNPHFLFNTLHAVSALIHENPEAADRVVARLSELLRLSLDTSRPPEIPLREEMEFLDRYLEIEQTRFADRLTVEKSLEAETLDALVPCLLLQPLVENAVRHGIEPREEAGVVSISAQRSNGRLKLCVSDNGAGLGGKQEEPLQEGIGLSNTRSRLRHLYGEDFRVELRPRNTGGLDACVEIPYHTREARATESAPRTGQGAR